MSPATTLIGREPEQERLTALLNDARDGTSGVLVIAGDAGIGKSAILEWASEQATDFRIIRCSGAESEVDLPYGGLGQLLRPLRDGLAQLSPTQAGALHWIVGSHGGAATAPPAVEQDRFALAAATLALVAAVSETQPVLALIDDAHWLDQSSMQALIFVARRLLAEGVVLLFSRRTGDYDARPDGLPVVQVTGLAPGAAANLLSAAGAASLTTTRVEQLVAASDGNPLALLELSRLLTEDELAGLIPAHQPLPIADALLHAYSAQFDQLSDDCRRAVAVVALVSGSDLLLIGPALREAGLALSDLSEAEDAGLIEVTPTAVIFRHPLVRSAAAYSAPVSWRRRAHVAIGRSLARAGSHAQRIESAWHLAAGALGPDEETAARLQLAAEQAAKDAGWAAAALTYERAGLLSPADADRYRRLVLASNAAFHAGLISKCQDLLESATAMAVMDPASSLLAGYTQLRIQMAQGRLRDAVQTSTGAAAAFAETHPVEAGRLLGEGVVAALYLAEPAVVRTHTQRTSDLVREDPVLSSTITGMVGLIQVIQGEFIEGRQLLAPIVDLARAYAADRSGFARELLFGDPEGLQYVAWFGNGLFLLDELALSKDLSAAALQRSREAGIHSVVPYCLTIQAAACLRLGEWKVARANLAQAVDLAEEMQLSLEVVNALAVRALVESHFGSEVLCRSIVQEGLAAASRQENNNNGSLLRLALGILELRLGNLDSALHQLELCRQMCQRGLILDLGHWHWAPELVEAYVYAGAREKAEPVVAELTQQAERSNRAILKAFSLRCQGLLTNDYDAFDEALRWHEGAHRPFELARTHLCYGERLRRDKKRGEARRQLEQAWQQFRVLGAEGWAARAAAELAATGVRIERPNGPVPAGLLTPQELQVGLAVAGGATNREAAAQLFLSPKTVEYHLGRVFRKLQITSRSQVAEALGSG